MENYGGFRADPSARNPPPFSSPISRRRLPSAVQEIIGHVLLRTIRLRPGDEDLGDGQPELVSGGVVHREMDARPNAGIAGLLAYSANELVREGWEPITLDSRRLLLRRTK